MRAARRSLLTAVLVVPLLAGCGDEGGGFEAGPGAEPRAGRWKTWVLSSPTEVEVPAPPEGERARAEEEEARRLAAGARPEDRAEVDRWSQVPPTRPWLDFNIELVAAGVKDPPLASRGYSLTSIAMYDAVVAAYHWKYEYERRAPATAQPLVPAGPDPSYPSEHAVIAGAASRVLTYLFPERPVGLFDELAEKAANSRVLAGVNYRSDVEAGLALGRAVADKVIARARTDGSEEQWDGARPPGIGRGPQFWEPPPGSVTPPTQPLAGRWKTWVLRSGDQLRAPAPPAYGSAEHVAAAQEVMNVRAKLTPEQERIARFWAGAQGSSLPPGIWNQIAQEYITGARLTTPRAARLLASLNAAEHDAAVATWDTKYAYWTARPLNAIRDLGLDPNWRSLLNTPTFPSYTSGHAGYSGAAAEVLSFFFGWAAETFRDKAAEAAESRLYGGIHYRYDNEVGLDLGHEIGRMVVERLRSDNAGT
ncbi:MAG TPA: phosphatase PAP2 family protein [Acidimicrobiales bacterium]|nr:phosphatase PAP2 family protein [Acidimicrobiales bacterium]